MTIYDYNENNWIAAWEYVDLKEKYNTTYGHNKNYYDSTVHDNRRKLVEGYTDLKNCFDYGCGKTPFYNKDEVNYSWDKYTEGFTEFDLDKFKESEVLLLFDVLEHIYDPESFLLTIPQNKCIITIPIVPGNTLKSLEDVKNWKHYKPGEHFWYFTLNGFETFINKINWRIVYSGQDECPPRSDIYSFIIER